MAFAFLPLPTLSSSHFLPLNHRLVTAFTAFPSVKLSATINFTTTPTISFPAQSPAFSIPRSAAVSVCSDVSNVAVGENLPVNYADYLPKSDSNGQRRAGILLHPTSLPGPHGIGDFGEQAFQFLDWLHDAGCSVWQVLPLVPPGRKANEDGSPYAGQDANLGNILLISLEELIKDGLLTKEELPEPRNVDKVNFNTVAEIKDPLVTKAAKRLISSDNELKRQFDEFWKDPSISSWLVDSAFFAAIDSTLDSFSWCDWPEPLRNRHLSAMEEIYQAQEEFIKIFMAEQFLFQRQWYKIRSYAQVKGISIMGDMPIYVGHHSADVWANKKHFLLDKKGFPLSVSGVPPDAFSNTGQLWGSPLYNWKTMEEDGFSWWIRRIRRANDLYDEFRIDHFRGFAGFWAVPYEENVALNGQWQAGPRKSLFDAIVGALGKIDIIAEDLGVITEDVVELRRSIEAPGMAVLQFGFGGDAENPHLPHNYEINQVAYTGTHDNDTVLGWWDNLSEEEKSHVMSYLSITGEDISWEMIQVVLSSVAKTAIIPMQDILRLGSCARMNTPATQFGNWNWRIPASGGGFESFGREATRLRQLLSLYGRLSD